MQLSVIIVSYNTADLTIQTLQSLEADIFSSEKLKNKAEVFVVDNNSTDDSIQKLKSFKHSSNLEITIIENNTNSGFAAANNQAIERSTGKFILLLNSDTVVQLGALDKMITAFQYAADAPTAVLSSATDKLDHLGILAATLLNEDETIQPQGGSFPTLTSLFFHMSLLDDIPLLGKLLPSTQHTGLRHNQGSSITLDSAIDELSSKPDLLLTDWVGGTAMMIRRSVIKEIGLLDSAIFMYGEDIEFCMRASAHHWDVAIHNGAYITHLGSRSGSSENALQGELLGYIYIWSKHKPLWQLPLAKGILLFGILLRIIIFSILNKRHRAAIYLRLLHSVQKTST
jgi:GT2 family glycosyltransferase